jgi:lactate dehydrogenase-like 2-hydroxyacid dehydrogenase
VLGIIGFGKIGFRIAQKAVAACEMRVWYHDVGRFEGKEGALRALSKAVRGCTGQGEGVGQGEEEEEVVKWCAEMEELLRGSDCVVLATPFSGSVLLSRREFAMFKPGARLVNIARGKLVDEEALVEALDAGVVSAAGLDVHANEPYVNERLALRDNVMVLSHTAGASVESHVGFERLGMENLLRWLETGEAITPVNLQWLRERGG